MKRVFSHHFSREAEEPKPRPWGINLTTPSFFHAPPHSAQTLSRALHENTWGKGMKARGAGGGDCLYSLEEEVIHSSMWGRK